MRALNEMSVIQIEITNGCHLRCANCTRFVGHHRQPFFMDLERVERALDSLEGFPGHIGLMGGEPALHPQFREICELYRTKIPQKERRELWTAGYKWEEYRDIIHETFLEKYIAYNDHSDPDEGTHQPLLIAIEEVIDDRELLWKVIDNCWIQLRWSASITPKGAFFCEVAAAQDHLFEGPGGWPIEKGWWKRTPAEFQDQVRRYCCRCSAALPMAVPNNHEPFDFLSPGNARRLEACRSPKFLQSRYRIADMEAIRRYAATLDGIPGPVRGSFLSHPEWTPWNYRKQVWNAPGEGYLTATEVRSLQTGALSREEAIQMRDARMQARTPAGR